MGLKSKTQTAVAAAPTTTIESGSQAAIDRLKTTAPSETAKAIAKVQYKQTDYNSTTDAKSIRILRQGVYQHALISPALAGMQFSTPQEYLALVKDVAEKVIQMIEE